MIAYMIRKRRFTFFYASASPPLPSLAFLCHLFARLEILAEVIVKFTAGPRSVSVWNCVRLWPSHYIPPLALAALEGINDGRLVVTVKNEGTHPRHKSAPDAPI
jgi:hypothetical protein